MLEVTDNGKTIKKFNPFRIIIPVILLLILLIGVVAAYVAKRQPSPSQQSNDLNMDTQQAAEYTPVLKPFTPSALGASYVFVETNMKTESSSEKIYYQVDQKGEKAELFRYSFPETAAPWVITSVGAMSPDGKSVYYVEGTGSLMRYDIETKTSTLIKAAKQSEEDVRLADVRSYREVRVSPDNKKLGVVWVGWEVGGIALMDADGSNYKEFEGDSIAFSPDAKNVVIAQRGGVMGSSVSHLYVMDVTDSSSIRDILPKELKLETGETQGKDVFTPAWSPDGGKIAIGYSYAQTEVYSTDDPSLTRQEIYTINPDGTDFQRVTRNDRYSSDPVWLNATTLAYGLSDYKGASDIGIYTINENGQNNVLLSHSDDTVYRPISTLIDKHIVFASGKPSYNAAPIHDLFVYDVEAKKSVSLGSGEFVGWTK